jgi:hypothetical protein
VASREAQDVSPSLADSDGLTQNRGLSAPNQPPDFDDGEFGQMRSESAPASQYWEAESLNDGMTTKEEEHARCACSSLLIQ